VCTQSPLLHWQYAGHRRRHQRTRSAISAHAPARSRACMVSIGMGPPPRANIYRIPVYARRQLYTLAFELIWRKNRKMSGLIRCLTREQCFLFFDFCSDRFRPGTSTGAGIEPFGASGQRLEGWQHVECYTGASAVMLMYVLYLYD
jgi:hypothetical protein